jgi:glucose/arabinose dehydrogenase
MTCKQKKLTPYFLLPRMMLNTFLTLLILSTFTEKNASAEEAIQSSQHNFRIVEMASGLERPWGIAFLPNGDMLVTEKAGRLRIIRDGKLDPQPIDGLPDNIFAEGQGGLLDVQLHPDFEKNKLVYISYAGRDGKLSGTEVARGELSGNRLENVETIFVATPKTSTALHYGSRLVFASDGTLLITLGDKYHRMKDAQNPANHLGSIIRIHSDGSIPEDNPFIGKSKTHKAEVYSYGHRNVQGLAIRPTDQTIWAHEHGPRGGDEVNTIKPGANYGWPAITYGIDYSGAIISDQTHSPGMEQPIVYWDPSIAPCGMTFYDGDAFPNWKGDLFVGALVGQHLRRLEMRGDKVIEEEVLLKGLSRIRDVETGPDGYLYLLTDDFNGKVLRLEPALS